MSDSRYRLTLELWASRYVPAGAAVTGVDVHYDDGYDPTFTDRPESLRVVISYTTKFGDEKATYIDSMEQFTSVGELLTALFAIEETP